MEIIISNNSSKPIYEQITTQIKAMIITGQLQAGEPIPSMRALAKSLHISILHTITDGQGRVYTLTFNDRYDLELLRFPNGCLLYTARCV